MGEGLVWGRAGGWVMGVSARLRLCIVGVNLRVVKSVGRVKADNRFGMLVSLGFLMPVVGTCGELGLMFVTFPLIGL